MWTKRLLLALPVVLIGAPLAVYLLAHSAPPPPFPEDVPEVALLDDGSLPDAARMQKLAADDPVRFLEFCLLRYRREVHGYRCTLHKQERIAGKLRPPEVVEVRYRRQPHSVYMHWLEGADRAERVLYVQGENNDQMLVRPNGALRRAVAGDVVRRDPNGPEARQAGRYSLAHFGIEQGTQRIVGHWQAARQRGRFHADYQGTAPVPQLGGRPCFRFFRSSDLPEEDGVVELTLFVDRDTWLQTGSILKGKDGSLIAQYFFRDVELNPPFPEGQFTAAALKP